MADTLSVTIAASMEWLRMEALTASNNVVDRAKLEYIETLADGTAVDTADKLWHDTRSILTTANDDLDLTALTQTIFGDTLTTTLAKVSAILIVNNSTTAGEELVVKADATNGFAAPWNGVTTSNEFIGPDGCWFQSNKKDAWTVDATHKVLRINNPNLTTVSYSIVIVGRSA